MRKRIYKTVAVLIAATMLLCDNSIISLAEETDTETVEEVINEGEPEEEIIEEEKTEEEIIEEEKPEEEIIEEEPTEEVIEEEPTEEEIIEEEKPEEEIIEEEPTEEVIEEEPTEEEPTEEEHPVEEVTTEEIMGVTFKSNDIAHGVEGDMAWAIDCDGNFVAKGQIASVKVGTTSYSETPWHDYSENIITADFAVISSDYSDCFEECENMTDVKLDFGDYGKQDVKNTSYMFYGCSSLTGIDLSGLNTSKVAYMECMFASCVSLTALDISSFDVSSLISAGGMFAGCEKLENLNLGAFETGKLIDFAGMFRNCKVLKQIDLSKCTYSGLRNSYDNDYYGEQVFLCRTFEGCSNLESVDLSGLSKCLISEIDMCFKDCTSLKSVKFGKNLYMNIYSCSTFENCSSLEEIDLSGFDVFMSNDDLCDDEQAMEDVKWYANFKGCTSLKKIITPQRLRDGTLYLPHTGTWYRNDTGEIITRFTGFNEYSVVLTRDELLKKDNTYSISYKLNDGVNNPENPTIYNDGETIKLKDPTRNGYKFVGWFFYDADQKKIKVTEISDGDFTVVAEWKAKTYSLKYVLNGGSFPKDVQHPSTYSADDMDFWSFLAPKRKGYTFEGWYLDAEYKDYVEWIHEIEFKNYTFYAKWAPVSYTARFHDGLESDQTVDEEFFYGKKKALLASKDVEFVNNGYYISAWTAKINGKNKKFKAGEKVTNLTEKAGEVIDFYPVWNEITYTVTYKANGGKGSVKKQTVKGLDEFTLRKNSFTRKGYTANGWVDDEGHEYASGQTGVSNLTNTNKANIVLNAVWVENEYTLRLCPGKGVLPEGKDDYETLTAKYSDMIWLPENIYIKEGYHFSGWNTKENGKGTTYGPGSSVSKLTATNLKEIKLYPVWKKNNDKAYVIIYDANGGTGKMTETVMKKTTKLKANAYKKAGYKFAGWQDAAGNTYSNKAQIKWSKELKGQILELTAVWESTEKK